MNVANNVTVAQAFLCMYKSQGVTASLMHIKAHDGAFYNELAECAAKTGASLDFVTGPPVLIGCAWFTGPTISEWAHLAFCTGSQRKSLGLPNIDGDVIVCPLPVACSKLDMINILHKGPPSHSGCGAYHCQS